MHTTRKTDILRAVIPANEERPPCTLTLRRETKRRERAYLKLIDDLTVQSWRLVRMVGREDRKLAFKLLRERAATRAVVEKVFGHFQWIGKRGCGVSKATKDVIERLVAKIRAVTAGGKSNRTSTYGKYTLKTEIQLTELIFGDIILPEIEKRIALADYRT